LEIAFEDKNKKNLILSQGKSTCGLLGQMKEHISQNFKTVAFDFSRGSFSKLSVGGDHAIGITSNNELYGWGSTQNGKLLVSGQNLDRPTKLPFLEGKPKKLLDV